MEHQHNLSLAPPLDTVAWLNSDDPITLEQLRGKVVVIHAFQMLCPSCVTHGLPQAVAIDELYRAKDVQVMGLHTVFEHHHVMTPEALAAFVHEYRIPFPIAIDRPSDTGPIPHTMASYDMRGTPTLVILDRQGRVRLNHFGRISYLQVGNIIGRLLEEKSTAAGRPDKTETGESDPSSDCGEDGCPV